MSSKAYSSVVRGKLSFKGDKPKVSSSRPTGAVSSSSSSTKSDSITGTKRPRAEEKEEKEESEPVEVQVVTGTGRLTSSGTTIHGHYTEFMKQLSVGDAIIITHPSTLQEETKVVRMVLSNTSMGISSAFSTDLISTTPFRFIKAPKDVVNEAAVASAQTERAHRSEEAAFGTYASAGGSRFTYRVKKAGAHGGYTIVTENTDKVLSREELLDLRTKKKADRHCY